MMMNMDKRVLEILGELGVSGLDWDKLKEAYSIRKEERDKDPKLKSRRRLNQKINEMMMEEMVKQ